MTSKRKTTVIHTCLLLLIAIVLLSLPLPVAAEQESRNNQGQALQEKQAREESEMRQRQEQERKALEKKAGEESTASSGSAGQDDNGGGLSFLGRLKNKVKNIISGQGSQQAAGAELSENEISAGLQEALRVGATQATDQASKAGAFLNNPDLHIPVPEKLHKIANTLSRYGLGKHVENFEESLNAAAEKASKKALPILAGAVAEMTFENASKTRKGNKTAITDYFRENCWQKLCDRFRPAVSAAVQEAGVARSYKTMTDFPAVEALAAKTDLDLDQYVTEKTLAGIFTLLRTEEEKIRTVPAARTTDLLIKIFGQ